MSYKCIRVLAISFSFAATAACAQAQTELDTLMPRKFIKQIQFFVGPNISNFWGNNSIQDQVINIQHCAGMGLSHPLNKSFDLQVKLLWELKGSKMDYQATFYDQNNEPLTWRFIQGTRLEYLTGSLTFNYYFSKRHKFYSGVGMSLSYLLKQETYTKQFDISSGNQISYYNSKTYWYRDVDAGCVMVIGFNQKLGLKTFFTTQLLGNIGIVDIISPEISNVVRPLRNYSVALLVGITINN
jgi:hypothetical protein